MTLKKLHNVLWFYAVCIIINSALVWSLINEGMGILGAAIASAISYSILSIMVVTYAMSFYLKRNKALSMFILKLTLPLFICVGLFVALEWLCPVILAHNKVLNEIFIFGFKVFGFSIFSLPILYIGIRKIKSMVLSMS